MMDLQNQNGLTSVTPKRLVLTPKKRNSPFKLLSPKSPSGLIRSRSASPMGIKRRSPFESLSGTPPAKRGRTSAPLSPVNADITPYSTWESGFIKDNQTKENSVAVIQEEVNGILFKQETNISFVISESEEKNDNEMEKDTPRDTSSVLQKTNKSEPEISLPSSSPSIGNRKGASSPFPGSQLIYSNEGKVNSSQHEISQRYAETRPRTSSFRSTRGNAATVVSNGTSSENMEKVPIRPRSKAPITMSTSLLLETYQKFNTWNTIVSQEKKSKHYPVKIGEVLGNKYRVLDFLGKGSFGQVVKAEQVDVSEQYFAIKIIRKSAPFLNQGKREVKILNDIKKSKDKGTNFIVQIIESFMHDGHLCIVFELLSHSLLDLVNLTLHADPANPGLSLRMVHKLTHQLVCVLASLSSMDIIHCDLKPENVALASPNKAHIKVLDFGSSCLSSENFCNNYPYIQSRFYRAPEILLGCHYGAPIDMWSLGCVVVELYTARPLFTGRDSVEQLYSIIDVLGPPPQSMLEQAVYLKRYFKNIDGKLFPKQKYKWRERKLRNLINVKQENPEHLDGFYDLVQKMLTYNPAERITPQDALNHPFILYGPAARMKVNSPTKPPENPFSRERSHQNNVTNFHNIQNGNQSNDGNLSEKRIQEAKKSHQNFLHRNGSWNTTQSQNWNSQTNVPTPAIVNEDRDVILQYPVTLSQHQI